LKGILDSDHENQTYEIKPGFIAAIFEVRMTLKFRRVFNFGQEE